MNCYIVLAVLALLEWLIKLIHYGNSEHFNALAEWLNSGSVNHNTPGCFNFATDSKTRIHDFPNWENADFFRNFAECGTHELKVMRFVVARKMYV